MLNVMEEYHNDRMLHIKVHRCGPGEMAQQLGALAALLENLGSVPNTHTHTHTHTGSQPSR